MQVRINVQFVGLREALAHFERLEYSIPDDIKKIMAQLGEDALKVMQEHTRKKTGRLREGDKLKIEGMKFQLINQVPYAKFIEYGHMTPRGWRTHHGGYRLARRRSHVGPFPFAAPTAEYISREILNRMSVVAKDAQT